jgi:NAD/NADP transhydrogenase beta subunit
MKPITVATMTILVAIALAHAMRLVWQVVVTIGGAAVPMWVSLVGVIVSPALAIGLWRENAPARRSAS